jgi:hypothetical protein
MFPRPVFALVALLLACGPCGPFATLGCSSSSDSAAPAVAPGVMPMGDGCQSGFALDAVTGACTEIVAATCPANTMPLIGQTDCQPVGWSTACPEGFQPGAGGWGCVDRFASPAPKCTGATREDVKTGTCVPIGDCTAAFPPAAATLFVDANGIEDATHFKTLTAANMVAKNGATIAIESGTYSEFLEVLATGVSVVGRCAEKVLFVSPGGPRAGIYAPEGASGTVSGVTVSGYAGGVLSDGGTLTVEDSLIDANNTLGLYAHLGAKVTVRRSRISNTTPGSALGSAVVVYDGSVVTLEDTAVVDNYFRQATVDSKDDGGPGVSTLIATRTLFARNSKYMGEESGISVINGGLVKLSQSAVLDSYGQGINVTGAKSHADLTESVVRRTAGALATNGGVGVIATTSGSVTLTSSAVTENPVLGVYAGGGGGIVTLDKSVIVGVPPAQKVEFGRGASASTGTLTMTETAVIGCPQAGIGLQTKGTGTFDHVYVRDSRPYPLSSSPTGEYGGFGMLVEDSSTAKVTNSTFEHNALAGLTSNTSSTVTAEAVLVRDTQELLKLTGGTGLQIAANGTMTMTRSAITGSIAESVIVTSGGKLSMTDSTVHGTVRDSDGLFGHGIAVFAMSRVDLTNTAVYDSAAVGLVGDGGGQAFVRGGTLAKNAVALHAQNGSMITQSDADSDLTAGEMRISTTTRFVANDSRVGSGVIVLPVSPLQ